MRRSDQHDPGRNSSQQGTSFAAWLPVLAAMAIMVTGCVSTFLVLQLDEFRPKVGDIVVFRPGSQDSEIWQMNIPASVVSTTGRASGECLLDPNAMATNGGSLVVESLRTEPSLLYVVHWLGIQSSAQAGGCGSDVDVMVSRTDLQRLANAAGGFGVGDKGITQ